MPIVTKRPQSCGHRMAVRVLTVAFCLHMALAAAADSLATESAVSLGHVRDDLPVLRKLMGYHHHNPPTDPGQDCLMDEEACRSNEFCNNCMQQNNALYWPFGVLRVCRSCLCNIDPGIVPSCYNCLSWARPGNTDGSYCTKCAGLYHNDPLGGAASAQQCFDCTVNMDGVCTQPRSCFDPPTVTSRGSRFTASLDEIAHCWNCMAQHRFYLWGKLTCGDPIQLGGETTNPLPPW